MSDIDPLTGHIEQLHTALNGFTTTSEVASVEVGPDGSLRAIRLTDTGRRLDPDSLAEAIVRLHAVALAESRQAVLAEIVRVENDPRLRAHQQRVTDALARPWPEQPAAPVPPASERAATTAPSRQPTPEEEEEMDRYYQRKSWLE
ncbi:hypothetical protein [Nocardia sp. NPDC019395]|uniref:hypothetical protein n=1 Tax=Nocardia sp. NPDC019395 TaxID=3154686 RepID=UPI0033FA0C88